MSLRESPRRLRRWVASEDISASKLNEVIQAVERMIRQATLQREIVRTTAERARRQQFRIKGVDGDFLRCAKLNGPWNAQEEDGVYYVAKPYLLQRTPFDGATTGRNGITYTYTDDSTRTASDGTYTEEEAIVPSYVVGDIIIASNEIDGFTMIQQRSDGTEFRVQWMDENRDGRAWAAA